MGLDRSVNLDGSLVGGSEMERKEYPCPGGAVRTGTSLRSGMPIHEGGPLTGEPDALIAPVRFGGRGDRIKSGLPYPYVRWRVY